MRGNNFFICLLLNLICFNFTANLKANSLDFTALSDLSTTQNLELAAKKHFEEYKKIPPTKDYQKQIDFYYSKFAQSNGNISYGAYFSRVLYDSGYNTSAFAYVRKVLDSNYFAQWFYEYFSDKLFNSKNPKALNLASDLLEKGIAKFPNSQPLNWLKAKRAFYSNPKSVLQILNSFSSLTIEQYNAKFVLELNQKDFSAAVATIQQAIVNYPEEIDFYRQIIFFYLNQENYELALNYIQTALKSFTEEAIFHNLKAEFYSRAGNFDQALIENKKAIVLDPENLLYKEYEVHLYWKLQKDEEVAELLQYLIDNDSKNIAFYQWLAHYYQTNSQPFSAEKVVLKALSLINTHQINDQSVEELLIYENALIQERQGKYQIAIANLEYILSKNKLTWKLKYDLARNYFKLNDISKAQMYFEEGMKLEDKDFYQNSPLAEFYFDILIEQRNFKKINEFLEDNYTKDEYPKWLKIKRAYIDFLNQAYSQASKYLEEFFVDNRENAAKSSFYKNLKISINQGLRKYSLAELDLSTKISSNSNYFISQLYLAKFRQGELTVSQAIKKYLASGALNLAYFELISYHNKSYLQRAWKNSSITIDTYEKIIRGENYLSDFDRVPAKWQGYLKFLANQFFVLPSFEVIKFESSNTDEAWMKFYQYYAQNYISPEDEDMKSRLLEQLAFANWSNPQIASYFKIVYYMNDNKSNYQLAIKNLEDYLKHYPNSLWAKIEISLCYDELNNDKQAERYLLEVLKAVPEHPTALNNLAWLYLKTEDSTLHNPNLALDFAKKAVQLEESASFLDTLAEAYLQTKSYKLAKQSIEKALSVDTSQSDHFKRQFIKIESALREALKQ